MASRKSIRSVSFTPMAAAAAAADDDDDDDDDGVATAAAAAAAAAADNVEFDDVAVGCDRAASNGLAAAGASGAEKTAKRFGCDN